MTRRATGFLTLLVLIILCMVFSYWAFKQQDSNIKAIAMGIITSFIASVVFALVTDLLIFRDPDTDPARLQELLAEAKNRQLMGIEVIKEKDNDNDPGFWLRILSEAQTELCLMGHALSQWTESAYENEFAETIIRLVKKKHRVSIMITEPDSDLQKRLLKATSKDYKPRSEKTINFIKEKIWDGLSQDEQKFLEVKFPTDTEMCYMLIKTNHNVYVAPYLAATDNQKPIMLIIKPNSPYGRKYSEDFRRIFATGKSHVFQ